MIIKRLSSFYSMLFIVGVIFSIVIILSDEKIEKYEQFSVSYGETLWSLADDYRGKMTKQDWIAKVEKINNISRNDVISGAILHFPIEQQSIHIAKEKEQQENVKVASDQ